LLFAKLDFYPASSKDQFQGASMKLIALFTFLFAFHPSSHACSTFLYAPDANNIRYGRNFDWNWDHALLITNKRNVAKTAIVQAPAAPAQWTSLYGSLTFNQIAREVPLGGMNERGLVIETLWLNSAVYPPIEQKPAVNEGQWIQYQLDNFATVSEVIAHVNDVRIQPVFAKVHFLVCDASATCATIEPINGKMEVHTVSGLPIKGITNNTYEESLKYAERFISTGACADVPKTTGSLDRFARAACELPEPTSKDPVARTMEILKLVDQGAHTKWSIAYDPKNLRIDFHTFQVNQMRNVSLKDFDFSCGVPVMVHDVNALESGDLRTKFVEYTSAANRLIVEKSLKGGMMNMPDAFIDFVVGYPDTTKCLN
jgi:choloylglycine hydrolase